MVVFDYAKHENGQFVYIDDVENGVACNCVCPECGDKLIAHNNGMKMAHHFQHYTNNEHEMNGMTRLHKLSQLILQKKFNIDIYFNSCTIINSYDFPKSYLSYPKVNKKLVHGQFENGILEHRVSSNVKDIIYDIWYPTTNLAVEIYVTHRVDEEKKKIISNRGDWCIEIDLSRVRYDISYSDLESLLQLHLNLLPLPRDLPITEISASNRLVSISVFGNNKAVEKLITLSVSELKYISKNTKYNFIYGSDDYLGHLYDIYQYLGGDTIRNRNFRRKILWAFKDLMVDNTSISLPFSWDKFEVYLNDENNKLSLYYNGEVCDHIYLDRW